eukprot:7254599-Prymnesium_polylepis.1
MSTVEPSKVGLWWRQVAVMWLTRRATVACTAARCAGCSSGTDCGVTRESCAAVASPTAPSRHSTGRNSVRRRWAGSSTRACACAASARIRSHASRVDLTKPSGPVPLLRLHSVSPIPCTSSTSADGGSSS